MPEVVLSTKKPTPPVLKNVFKAILFASAIWALAIAPNLDIPDAVVASINKWLLVGNGIVKVTIGFFGLDYSKD